MCFFFALSNKNVAFEFSRTVNIQWFINVEIQNCVHKHDPLKLTVSGYIQSGFMGFRYRRQHKKINYFVFFNIVFVSTIRTHLTYNIFFYCIYANEIFQKLFFLCVCREHILSYTAIRQRFGQRENYG